MTGGARDVAQLLHEEEEKSRALQTLVEQLIDASQSLQRKWEQSRGASTPPPAAAPLPSPPPALEPELPMTRACAGVLVVRLLLLEAFVTEDRDASVPIFLELWLDEGAVRSHAWAGDSDDAGEARAQTFALPVRQPPPEPASSAEASPARPLALCATVCESDGDGGGRPIAIAVLHPHVAAMAPFEKVGLRAILREPTERLPYCHATPSNAASGPTEPWRDAWRACIAAHAEEPEATLAQPGAQGAVGVGRIALSVEWRPFVSAVVRSDESPSATASTAHSPSSRCAVHAGDDGHSSLPPTRATTTTARGRSASASDTSATAGTRERCRDALGFETCVPSAGRAHLGAAGPHARATRHAGRSDDLDCSSGPGPRRSAEARAADSAHVHAARMARGAVSGWWEYDTLALARWNAAMCSVGSLDELPPSRLRWLLAAGVPMQHRLHVWGSCARAGRHRRAYRPSLSTSVGASHSPMHGDAVPPSSIGSDGRVNAERTSPGSGGGGEAGRGAEVGGVGMGGGGGELGGDGVSGGGGEDGDLWGGEAGGAAGNEGVTDEATGRSREQQGHLQRSITDPATLESERVARQAEFEAAERTIELDLLRTFPSHPFFDTRSALLIDPLRRVLHAFGTPHSRPTPAGCAPPSSAPAHRLYPHPARHAQPYAHARAIAEPSC